MTTHSSFALPCSIRAPDGYASSRRVSSLGSTDEGSLRCCRWPTPKPFACSTAFPPRRAASAGGSCAGTVRSFRATLAGASLLAELRLTQPVARALRAAHAGRYVDALDKFVARHRGGLGRFVPDVCMKGQYFRAEGVEISGQGAYACMNRGVVRSGRAAHLAYSSQRKGRAMRSLITSAVAIAAVAICVPAAFAAQDNGAGKSPLLNHGFGFCDGTGLGGLPQDGFAIIKQNGDGTVSEEVSVKNGPPNATYFVSLVQTPNGVGCNSTNPNVELTTNGQGNGNIHVNVPIAPGTTDALAELIPANAAASASGLIISHDVVF